MTTKTKTAAQSRSKAPAPRSAPEPVGVLEIAERLGVAQDTVQKWKQRFTTDEGYDLADCFPAARWSVGGASAWDWRDVKRWAHRTGREVVA